MARRELLDRNGDPPARRNMNRLWTEKPSPLGERGGALHPLARESAPSSQVARYLVGQCLSSELLQSHRRCAAQRAREKSTQCESPQHLPSNTSQKSLF